MLAGCGNDNQTAQPDTANTGTEEEKNEQPAAPSI